LDDPGQDALLINLLADEHSRAGKDGKHHLVIEAYGYRWYRVGGLDYLLRRSEIEKPAPPDGKASNGKA
jgi:maltose alpha-D-glucosyltransferase/alpha-amylase